MRIIKRLKRRDGFLRTVFKISVEGKDVIISGKLKTFDLLQVLTGCVEWRAMIGQ